jgi:ribosomal protein L34E
VDRETFQKVGRLLENRRHTQSRSYDFLLKGLIFCHECGHPLGVINRPTNSGEDRLYFICRTYQRATRERLCSTHCIKESVVTEAVLAKVHKLFTACAEDHRLRCIAQTVLEERGEGVDSLRSLRAKISSANAKLDRMYMDKLSGLLSESDFARIYERLCSERTALEEELSNLETKKQAAGSRVYKSEELVQEFLNSAYTSRDILVSLIERIELTEDRQIIIKFRFREL